MYQGTKYTPCIKVPSICNISHISECQVYPSIMVPSIPNVSRYKAYAISSIYQNTKYIQVLWHQVYPMYQGTKYSFCLSGYQAYTCIRVPSISLYQDTKCIPYPCIRVPSISMYQITKYIYVLWYQVYPCIMIPSISMYQDTKYIHVSGFQVYSCIRVPSISMY